MVIAQLMSCWALALVAAVLVAIPAAESGDGGVGDGELVTLALADPGEGYRLYPGDLIRIQVYDHSDLSVDLRIPTSGQITFPLIGKVDNVVGITDDAFAGLLKTHLEDGYIRQAVISVAVVEFGPRRVYVMGSVTEPRSIELSPFSPLTAMQAIGQVGGFTEDANRGAAQVLRTDPDHEGAKLALPIPGSNSPDALASDVALQPGDLIIVPRLDRVYIIGEVNKPGAVNLPTNGKLTVSKAVSLVGGFARFARKDEVQLLRVGEQMRVIDVAAVLSGDRRSADPVLQPGDTVFVPESRF
jgi:polysaccharide biosynthesis/export protein